MTNIDRDFCAKCGNQFPDGQVCDSCKPTTSKVARAQQLAGLSPEYAKYLTAIVGQGLTFASLYYGTKLWVAAAIAVASALGVRAVPNRQGTAPVFVAPPTSSGGSV